MRMDSRHPTLLAIIANVGFFSIVYMSKTLTQYIVLTRKQFPLKGTLILKYLDELRCFWLGIFAVNLNVS